MVQRVVIGVGTLHGFGLSKMAVERLIQLGVEEAKETFEMFSEVGRDLVRDDWSGSLSCDPPTGIKRDDPRLIQVVEELGLLAFPASYHHQGDEPYGLKIVSIPDDVEWEVVTPDVGGEWIQEKHRTWT